jgi:DNA-directed RNA polymerase specialized sigma24 family protein|tara:strand:- start:862 stop:1401 length:540 start_codon:yes stop_codon:yes gene_type:complete
MGTAKWLEIVAKQHKEWIRIVNGFGEYDYAEDIVQESYLILYKYAKPEKVIENGNIRRGYMYFTLRTTYYLYYNSKRKVRKVSIDDGILQLEDTNDLREQEAYNKICEKIDEEIENWHWYDKKLFILYRDTPMSIRKIASETKISWVSIFNTLKNSKNIIKDKLSEDYEDYKNEDYERL